MRGLGFLRFNEQKKKYHKPPHPSPLPQGGEGTVARIQPQTLYHKTWPFQPPFSPSGEKVAGGRMRGPGFLRFNEHEKDTKHKPPHPGPLPQGVEGTVAEVGGVASGGDWQ